MRYECDPGGRWSGIPTEQRRWRWGWAWGRATFMGYARGLKVQNQHLPWIQPGGWVTILVGVIFILLNIGAGNIDQADRCSGK